MSAYYNEHDPFAAAWLRELIADGLIPAGHVDERDIQLVQPADLAGYEQCHFFAGIGGWAYALELAGWSGPVWTGSCPCQPFSAAGKGAGFDDTRHLWPSWFRLIRECRPPVVFGEQVASADGLAWFDTVSTDLEAEAYAVGAADLAAASVGAPHLRQRLFFVADAGRRGLRGVGLPLEGASRRDQGHGDKRQRLRSDAGHGGHSGVALGDTLQPGLEGHAGDGPDGHKPGRQRAVAPRPTPSTGWADLDWLPCTDGKARPTRPGLFPLAHGIPNRVGTLRGAGNAIVPQVAAQFIGAFMEAQT